jgi:hypothetical protein
MVGATGLERQPYPRTFGKGHLPYALDLPYDCGLLATIPTLTEMTQVALDRLASSQHGFLLQVKEAGWTTRRTMMTLPRFCGNNSRSMMPSVSCCGFVRGIPTPSSSLRATTATRIPVSMGRAKNMWTPTRTLSVCCNPAVRTRPSRHCSAWTRNTP